MLNTLLAASVLLCGSPLFAGERNPLVPHAETLSRLSADMEDEFQGELKRMHKRYGPSRTERHFLESLCQLASASAELRRAVETCASGLDLERDLEKIRRTFDCVEHSAEDVRVCVSVRSMMRQFETTLHCLEHEAERFVAHRGHSHDHGHGHDHDRRPASKGSRIEFRVPIPQVPPPFVFRQPMR